jgi:surface antigen
MTPRLTLIGACLALALSACDTPPIREQTGMVVGGIVGGVIASEIGHHSAAGTIIGTIAGAALGGAVGHSMDENDPRRTARVLETAPTGQSSRWVNPDTGASW